MPDIALSPMTIRKQGLTSTKSKRRTLTEAIEGTLLVQTIEEVLEVEVLGVPRKCWNNQTGVSCSGLTN
jgi:hypothetical protein